MSSSEEKICEPWVRDAIFDLCEDNDRYNQLCRQLEKKYDWVKNSLHQNWEAYLDLAIERLLDGSRQWNKDRYPQIEEQIAAIVDSLVSHDYDAKKKSVSLTEWTDLENQECVAVMEEQPYVDSDLNLKQQILSRLRNSRDFNKLQQIVKFRLEHEPSFKAKSGRYLWAPSEIAKELGWDSNEINRLTKQLRNRLNPLRVMIG